MRGTRFIPVALGALIAATAFAGCSSGSPSASPSPTSGQSQAPASAAPRLGRACFGRAGRRNPDCLADERVPERQLRRPAGHRLPDGAPRLEGQLPGPAMGRDRRQAHHRARQQHAAGHHRVGQHAGDHVRGGRRARGPDRQSRSPRRRDLQRQRQRRPALRGVAQQRVRLRRQALRHAVLRRGPRAHLSQGPPGSGRDRSHHDHEQGQAHRRRKGAPGEERRRQGLLRSLRRRPELVLAPPDDLGPGRRPGHELERHLAGDPGVDRVHAGHPGLRGLLQRRLDGSQEQRRDEPARVRPLPPGQGRHVRRQRLGDRKRDRHGRHA